MAKVKMIGDVVKRGNGEFSIKYIGYGRDGKEYPELYDVRHEGKLPKIGKDQRLMVLGHTEYDPESMEIWIQAEKMEATTEPYCNLAKANGTAVGAFQFFERMDSKVSFGNGLIKTDDGRWQRGVAFGYLATRLARNFRTGAIVRLAGRLRKQVYEKNGEERSLFEIILDTEGTKILQKAPDGDQFDFDDEQEQKTGIVPKLKKAVTGAINNLKEAEEAF